MNYDYGPPADSFTKSTTTLKREKKGFSRKKGHTHTTNTQHTISIAIISSIICCITRSRCIDKQVHSASRQLRQLLGNSSSKSKKVVNLAKLFSLSVCLPFSRTHHHSTISDKWPSVNWQHHNCKCKWKRIGFQWFSLFFSFAATAEAVHWPKSSCLGLPLICSYYSFSQLGSSC